MTHDIAHLGFPLWLRLIFQSHPVDEQGREHYDTGVEI